MTNASTSSINTDSEILSNHALTATILMECKLASRRAGRKYGFSKMHDLEGYLVAEVWEMIQKKEQSFHTTMFIRRLIRLRTINYIEREAMPLNKQSNFSDIDGMNTNDGDQERADNFEAQIPDTGDIELGTALGHFLGSLSAKQRQILDLVNAGYGTYEIMEITGCSINTPKNTMKKIKELAVAFGL